MRVLLLTNDDGLIPQRVDYRQSLDLNALGDMFKNTYGCEVFVSHLLSDSYFDAIIPEKTIALYATSHFPNYRQALMDAICAVEHAGALLYPNLRHLMAYENKSFQSYLIRLARIPSPKTKVLGSSTEIDTFLALAKFPFVCKLATGYGSAGVWLAKSANEARRHARHGLLDSNIEHDRPHILKAWHKLFPPKNRGRIVFQEFVPGCPADWKILIWGNEACGLYRLNRKGDFRASGSGLFDWREIPVHILDFAYCCLNKLGALWGSLDILESPTGCQLLEFQIIHFGLTARDKGKEYYIRHDDGQWERREGRIDVERQMVKLIHGDYIRQTAK